MEVIAKKDHGLNGFLKKRSKESGIPLPAVIIIIATGLLGIFSIVVSLLQKNTYFSSIGMILVITQLLCSAFVDKDIRKLTFLVILTPILIIVLLASSVSLAIALSKVSNGIYNVGESNWLMYFGAIFGAAFTVLGAFIVSRIEVKKTRKAKTSASKIILVNDLKYISEKVQEYINLLLQNERNEDFFRIRYLDICDNWRELISQLKMEKYLNNEDVSILYKYFTDLLYLSSKYSQLQNLNYNDLSNPSLNMDQVEKKRQIKTDINKKYLELSEYRIDDVISKLKKG